MIRGPYFCIVIIFVLPSHATSAPKDSATNLNGTYVLPPETKALALRSTSQALSIPLPLIVSSHFSGFIDQYTLEFCAPHSPLSLDEEPPFDAFAVAANTVAVIIINAKIADTVLFSIPLTILKNNHFLKCDI